MTHVDGDDYTAAHPDATPEDHIWALIRESGVLIRSENPGMTAVQALKYLADDYEFYGDLLSETWKALAPDSYGGIPIQPVQKNAMVLMAGQLRAENARLRAALEWYANESHYHLSDYGAAICDRGARARAALKGEAHDPR